MTTWSRRGVLGGALAVVALGLGGAAKVLAQAPTITVYKSPT